MISEDVNNVIKVETDLLDDCMWHSQIDIAKDVDESRLSTPSDVYQVYIHCLV